MAKKRYVEDLLSLLALVKDKREMLLVLQDILTPAEFDDIVVRLQIIKLLSEGKTQREVAKELGISIAKVTRGARARQTSKSKLKNIYKNIERRV